MSTGKLNLLICSKTNSKDRQCLHDFQIYGEDCELLFQEIQNNVQLSLSFKVVSIINKNNYGKIFNQRRPVDLQYFYIRRNCSIMKCYVRDVYMEWDTSPK